MFVLTLVIAACILAAGVFVYRSSKLDGKLQVLILTALVAMSVAIFLVLGVINAKQDITWHQTMAEKQNIEVQTSFWTGSVKTAGECQLPLRERNRQLIIEVGNHQRVATPEVIDVICAQ